MAILPNTTEMNKLRRFCIAHSNGLAKDLIVPRLRVDTLENNQQILRVESLLECQEARVMISPVRLLPVRLQNIGLQQGVSINYLLEMIQGSRTSLTYAPPVGVRTRTPFAKSVTFWRTALMSANVAVVTFQLRAMVRSLSMMRKAGLTERASGSTVETAPPPTRLDHAKNQISVTFLWRI